MARINVEKELFQDRRFLDLAVSLKDPDAALGAVIRCWMIAQDYWKHSDNGVPKSSWNKQRLPKELIECGLAEDRGDFVYVIGSEKHFGWIRERIKAGRSGGLSKNDSAKRKAKRAKRNPLTSTSSLSSRSNPSSSTENKDCSAGQSAGALAVQDEIRSPRQYFIATYVRAFGERYPGARPDLTGKTQGEISRYLDDTPIRRACEMIQAFIRMNDSWFLTKVHDFTTFANNQNKVALYLDTGNQMLGTTAREVERRQHNADTWQRAAEAVNAKIRERNNERNQS